MARYWQNKVSRLFLMTWILGLANGHPWVIAFVVGKNTTAILLKENSRFEESATSFASNNFFSKILNYHGSFLERQYIWSWEQKVNSNQSSKRSHKTYIAPDIIYIYKLLCFCSMAHKGRPEKKKQREQTRLVYVLEYTLY